MVPAKAGRAEPQPLATAEAAILRQVFALQARGETDAAQRAAAALQDRRLEGHILADRWLSGAAPPRPEEARAWLERHGDHPDAPAIRVLLARLAHAADPAPQPAEPDLTAPEEREAPAGFTRDPALDRAVRERATAGDPEGAQRLLRAHPAMTPAYGAALRAEIALAQFRQGRAEPAFRIAAEAARSGQDPTGRAAFAAGLAAWSLGHWAVALPYFETAARAGSGAAATRAGAAFWTARAALRARQPRHYTAWMLQAAQEPRTFYGLIARRALGLPAGFAWRADPAPEGGAGALMETAGGWRALALLQIGQTARAEAELRLLAPAARGNAALLRAMLGVASRAGMTGLAARLAALAQGADGRPRDLARFPLPALAPGQGYRVDPALLYAMARQESNFDPAAISPAGARGLMQIMPATASLVAGDASFRGAGAERLHEPGLSLDLGQRYLLQLARLPMVQGDLVRLLAAYNAGPGNVARWQSGSLARDDPFLAIESIPFEETRLYVQRVLAYSWIYASRLGLPAESLDVLASGGFPRFRGEEATAALGAGRLPEAR